jgi:hypothetical protein
MEPFVPSVVFWVESFVPCVFLFGSFSFWSFVLTSLGVFSVLCLLLRLLRWEGACSLLLSVVFLLFRLFYWVVA